MMTKPRYAKNHESTVHWMPYDQLQEYNRTHQVPSSSRRSMIPASRASQAAQSQTADAVPNSKRSTHSAAPPGVGVNNKTLNNRSSVKHNIISGQENIYSAEMKPGLLDKQVCNRKLGITQIRDLSGPNAINRNPDHKSAFDESQNVFKRQNGIFTHLYNAAHRFGETEVFKT